MRQFNLVVVIALLSTSAPADARADWRADLRAAMRSSLNVEQVLGERGTLLSSTIGEDAVTLTWSNGTLHLFVNNAPINDLQQWYDDAQGRVLAFSAFTGHGLLGPLANAGLVGWVYLDDLDGLRIELEPGVSRVTYQFDESGQVARASPKTCVCYKPGYPKTCTPANCANTDACPNDGSHFCQEINGSFEEFAAVFNAMVDAVP